MFETTWALVSRRRTGRRAPHVPVLTAALLLSATPSPVHAENERRCEQLHKTTVTSPDGLWAAVMYEEVCDLGMTSSDAIVVDLAFPDNPSRTQAVIAMSTPSRRHLWPRVRWGSPSKLIVELAAGSQVALRMAHYQGVDVEVSHCADDPQEHRACQRVAEVAESCADTSKAAGPTER